MGSVSYITKRLLEIQDPWFRNLEAGMLPMSFSAGWELRSYSHGFITTSDCLRNKVTLGSLDLYCCFHFPG